MRFFRWFAYIFSAFAFLTIGSLMLIVALHVLSMEDALLKVESLYESTWQSTRIGISGLIFVIFGLVFSKLFVKALHPSDDVILYGPWGHVNASIGMIKDLVRRVLRKLESVSPAHIIIESNGHRLQIEIDLLLVTEPNLKEVTEKIRDLVTKKLRSVLGAEIPIELTVNYRGVAVAAKTVAPI